MVETRQNKIIQTRIMPPKAPQNIVSRSGMMELLASTEGRKLLLVTAPAGYGKTTLVNEFISSSGKPVSWVHITPAISGIFSLLTYLIFSLRKIKGGFGNN